MPSVVTEKSLSKSSEEGLNDESDYYIGYMSNKTDKEIVLPVVINNVDVPGIQEQNSNNSGFGGTNNFQITII